MRKNLKRIVSTLLVLAMILTMLPAVLAAAPTYTANPINGVPQDKQAVVIYSQKGSGVFGTEFVDGVLGISSASVSEESNTLTIRNGAGIYMVLANTDGTVYLTCGGKYLTCSSSQKLSFTDAPQTGSKWRIEENKKTDAGGCFIINNDVKRNGADLYLEFFSGFKPYTYGANYADSYPMFFYSVDVATVDPDGDGYAGAGKPTVSALPQDGQTVVIYNENAGAVMGPQSDDQTAPSLGAIEATVTSTGIEVGNGGVIFTVHTDGTYYTFENNGKFLRTSENAEDGSNAECLYFDETESDYTKWTLEKTGEGYIMYNKIAKYKSSRVCIEYFGNSFSGWTFNGNADLFTMKFFPVVDELGIGYVLNPKLYFKANDAALGADYNFTVTADDLSEITTMTVQYATDGGAAVTLKPTAVEDKEYSYTVPKAALEGKSTLTLTAAAKNSYDMEYNASATVAIKDEPLILSVAPGANEATGSEKRPEISIAIANCGAKPTVVMTVDGETVAPTVTAEKVSYKAASNMEDGKHVVSISITREDGKKVEKTWSFFVGEAGMSLYFGQLHSHTAEYSDGAGQLEDAYEHAMQADDVDFLIVTDHSNYFDTTSTATKTSYYDFSSLTKTADGSMTKWEEAKRTAEKYNAMSDDFVAAYGYEMTWSGGPGHTNTFNTYGTVSRNNAELNNKSNNYAGMHLYNDLMVNANKGLDVDGNPVAEGVKTKWLEDAPVVSQFNHPGKTFGTFDDFAGYTPNRDAVLNLVEVGNGEGLVGGSSYFPSYSEYDKALSKGWHVAPTNNQDNHKGNWGDANTCRDVIMTDDFTEAGLYKAIAERRVYSTEDQNLRIYYYLNDAVMGSIIPVEDGAEVKEVHITCSISDPDGENLGKVEIIGANGISLKSFEANGATFELDTTIPNTDAYYYIKVTQEDGDIAVTAPVWVGEATPITCDIDSDAALSVVGQKETVSSTLTNAATMDYTLTKVEFTLITGDTRTVIKTFENSEVIAAGSSKTYSFDYVRTIDGPQSIEVLYTGTYNGKDFKCTATMTQTVYKADELINVGVDKGHDNFYISGDYAGSADNFIDFCAQNGVQCSYIEAGEFTSENLSKYAMLVLTVPYRRNTAKANMYTAEEIAALKQYTDNGGKVILCSKSDRDNKFDNCADNTNALLEAIGAHTRVVNGIIVDNDLKANEAYRIYFSAKENFNTEHPFTAGAYTSSNAFGTTPASDNQTGFQVYNGAPVKIIEGGENVEVLVQGYQSTWGSHYDGYFDGGAFVPVYDENNEQGFTVAKGDVDIMTYEDLPGGGWVLTSGVTFFSNYDIKSDQDYANRFILQNILESLRDPAEITKISETHKGAEGEGFTIEGIVTANASGYDQDTAFFDCIYVQDETRGINLFPVAGNYCVGMKVRAYGVVTYYCGEIELNLSPDYSGSIKIISDDIAPLAPSAVSCATAMADSSIGNLMQIQGIVTDLHKTEGVIDKIYVRDASGTACLFINGYIMKSYTGLDDLKIGMTVSGVGIGSRDVDETSADESIFARLRVRNRSEIKILNNVPDMTALFNDVLKGVWYEEPIKFVVTERLFNGTAPYTFEPDSPLTRAMAATVLYRLSGEGGYTTKASFSDVPDGVWYTSAVSWAQENGVVNGYEEDGTFRPDNKITRQEMAAMLQRYAAYIDKADVTANGDLSKFPDANTVAPWAQSAISWCVANEIINGKDGKLDPYGDATRAEFAKIIYCYTQN